MQLKQKEYQEEDAHKGKLFKKNAKIIDDH